MYINIVAMVMLLLAGCATTPVTTAPDNLVVAAAPTVASDASSQAEAPILVPQGLFPVSMVGFNEHPIKDVIHREFRPAEKGGQVEVLYHPRVYKAKDGNFHLKKDRIYSLVATVINLSEKEMKLVKSRRAVSTGTRVDEFPFKSPVGINRASSTGWVMVLYKWDNKISTPIELWMDVETANGGRSNRLSFGPVVVDD